MPPTTKSVYEKVGVIGLKEKKEVLWISTGRRIIVPIHGYRLAAPFESKPRISEGQTPTISSVEKTRNIIFNFRKKISGRVATSPTYGRKYIKYKIKSRVSWEYQTDKEKIVKTIKDKFNDLAKTPEERTLDVFEKAFEEKCIKSKPFEITKYCFGVKNPIGNFVGRTLEVEKLSKWLQDGRLSTFLISGIGGQGKTELCKRFVQQLTTRTVVTWFRGDNQEMLAKSLSDVASAMNLPTMDSTGKSFSIAEQIQNIEKSIQNYGPDYVWLAVMDNVDEDYDEFLPAVVKLLENNAYILVTSRRTNILPADNSDCIVLPVLSDEASREIVNTALKNPPSEHVKKLCNTFQNYALALQQAVAYINFKQRKAGRDYGILKYLEEFNKGKLHDYKLGLSGYDKTIIKIIDMTISNLVKIDFKQNETSTFFVLHLLSLLKPDGIPLKFLQNLFSIFKKDDKFNDAIERLITLCMIHVENEVVSIHKVVQKFVRIKLESQSQDYCVLILDSLLKEINMTNLNCEEILHVAQLWIVALKKPEIAKVNLKFFNDLIKRFYDLFLLREANEFLKISRHHIKQLVGDDDIDNFLEICEDLSTNMLALVGNYEEPIENIKMNLGKKKNQISELTTKTFQNAAKMAYMLAKLNRTEEVTELEELFEMSLGENPKNSILVKVGTANDLVENGKNEEALLLYRQILECQLKKMNDNNPLIFFTRQFIVSCLCKQKKFKEAKKELKNMLKLSIEIYGPEHLLPLTLEVGVAGTLTHLGRTEEALNLYKKVLSQEKIIGINHILTKTTRHALNLLEVKMIIEKPIKDK